eukprot:TRINITY_DN612_c0_g2_i1.p1 TRINITY_DN612_c0_g2~~TRINITY_DN612_c0_g2_i1.p1  ORF type:complete len:234 (-),score=77.34 TRINITY_DN612_c0_g2_i1:223-876(-)
MSWFCLPSNLISLCFPSQAPPTSLQVSERKKFLTKEEETVLSKEEFDSFDDFVDVNPVNSRVTGIVGPTPSPSTAIRQPVEPKTKIIEVNQPPLSPISSRLPSPPSSPPPSKLSSSFSPTDLTNFGVPMVISSLPSAAPTLAKKKTVEEEEEEKKKEKEKEREEVDFFSGMEPSYVKPTIIKPTSQASKLDQKNRLTLDDLGEADVNSWGNIGDDDF